MEHADQQNGGHSADGVVRESLRRAAVLLTVAGVAEMLVSSALAALFAALAPLTPDQYAGATPALVPTALGPMAIALLTLGTLPGLACVLLSFPVRAHCRWATKVALLLVLTQCVVVGLLLLGGAASAIRAASPVCLTISIIMPGSVLGLLGVLVRSLLAARAG